MAGGSYQAVIGNFPPHLPEATFQKENNGMTWQEHTFTLRLQFWEDLHYQLQAPVPGEYGQPLIWAAE